MQANSTAWEAETVVIQKKIQMLRRIKHLRRGHRVPLHQDLRVHIHQDFQKGQSEGWRLSQLCWKIHIRPKEILQKILMHGGSLYKVGSRINQKRSMIL